MKPFFHLKRRLDHWARAEFFSLSQVRCFWHCLWFRSETIWGLRQICSSFLKDVCGRWLLMLWQQPQFTCSTALLCSRLFLTVLSRLFVHFFLPHFSLPVNFPCILFDTDLCTQPFQHWASMAYSPEGCWWSGKLSSQQSSPWLQLSVLS